MWHHAELVEDATQNEWLRKDSLLFTSFLKQRGKEKNLGFELHSLEWCQEGNSQGMPELSLGHAGISLIFVSQN